jgi:serine/threonine-protein kinase
MSGTTGQIDYFKSLIGREINSTYRIEDQLAIGGMGAVFRAVNLKQGERVAIKVISPHLAANPVFVKRFKREARVGCLLSHPHIVKVYEFGEAPDGLLFMVMEFIEGQTLGDIMERSGPMTVTRCLEIIKPLCEGLDAAHKRNILHRDLKPANILIAKDKNGKESVKLVDFGLVKILQPDNEITQGSTNLTAMGEACGTPFYMSPEQIIGQPLAPTADIYSLGVILFQMLTSKMPVESNSIRQILSMKINQDLPPPSQKYPFLPANIDKVLQKVLARDPRNRYQNGEELYRAFQQIALELTAEFSQPTEPTINSEMLDEVRKDYQPPPPPAELTESETVVPPPAKQEYPIKIFIAIIAVLVVLLIIALAMLWSRH